VHHVATTAWSPASDRKIYVVWIGLVWAAILAGFGLDFAAIWARRPHHPSSCMLMPRCSFSGSDSSLSRSCGSRWGTCRRHKQLGWLTVAVSVLMVPLGLAAALVDQARQVTHPDYAPQFLALEFEEMITSPFL